MKNIKAILFDSGRVLNELVTGHWFITPNFWKYVDLNTFYNLDRKKVEFAFSEANKYIIAQKLIITKEEEFLYFTNFYKTFSSHLPELNLGEEAVKEIARDLVFNSQKYRFYDEVFEVLTKLKEKYKLAIVSDAWPSLLDVYKEKKLFTFFEAVVISSFEGVLKPDSKMFEAAINKLQIKPEEAIFIDDNLNNCLGAMNSGIKAVLLCRDEKKYIEEKDECVGKGYQVINNLTQLYDLL